MNTIDPNRKSFESLAKAQGPVVERKYKQVFEVPEPSDIWESDSEPSGILFESMAADDVVLGILLDNALYQFEQTTGRKPNNTEISAIKFGIMTDEFAKVSSTTVTKKNYQLPRCMPRAVNTFNLTLDYNLKFIAGLLIGATFLGFMIIKPKAPIESVVLSPERIQEIYGQRVQPKATPAKISKTPYKPQPITEPVAQPGFYN
jgi:hypothetical protein